MQTANTSPQSSTALLPQLLEVFPENIPAALKLRNRWVVWRGVWIQAKGKYSKVPYQTNGYKASTRSERTWTSFSAALEAYLNSQRLPEDQRFHGVGYVLGDGKYAGVDLDHCRDRDTGELSEFAAETVEHFSSYTEVTPSGTGLRILVRGHLPPKGRKRGDVEVYERLRFLTLTGAHLDGTSWEIADRQDELTIWHSTVFGTSPTDADDDLIADSEPTAEMLQVRKIADDVLLQMAIDANDGGKFRRLWAGDLSGYHGDQSSADMALLDKLAFWTAKDAERMDSLYRRWTLARDKWDEPHYATGETYGEHTIAEAIGHVAQTFTPPGWIDHVPDPVVLANGNGHHAEPPPPPAAVETFAPPPRVYALTDLGNAERLVAQHGADLRYLHRWSKWIVWDGQRWAIDDSGAVMRFAKATIRGTYAELVAIPDETRRKELAKHAVRSESTMRLEAMIKSSASEAGIAVQPTDLDSDPSLLNVLNGTVDLRTGQLLEHDRSRLLSKLAPVVYDASALAPTWQTFLAEVIPSEAVRRYLQRMAGYCLTGDVSEQVLFFLFGGGANGKSTFIGTFLALLGEYGRQVSPDLLIARKHDGDHPTKLADLFGTRLAATIEVEQGKHLAEAILKQLTGGDRIWARRMREDGWEFDPTHKVILAANHRPVVRGTDHAIWRRIKLIPFPVKIAQPDKTLPARLLGELSGVLNWAVRGCLEWQRHGLGEPEEVKEATAAYRAEMDVVGQFLTDMCEVEALSSVSAKTLYDAYADWAKSNVTMVDT